MNRIKEVLEEKGVKQTWLAEKTVRVSVKPTPTSATAANPAWSNSSKSPKFGVDVKELIDNIEK